MSDVELDTNSDVWARGPKIQTGPTLKREVVDVADATVIEPERKLPVRQDKIIGIRAHAHTTHQRNDRAAVEMIETDLADWSDERHVALPRAGDVEMGAGIASGARLVVHEVVVCTECREVRIARLGERRIGRNGQNAGKQEDEWRCHGTSLVENAARRVK